MISTLGGAGEEGELHVCQGRIWNLYQFSYIRKGWGGEAGEEGLGFSYIRRTSTLNTLQQRITWGRGTGITWGRGTEDHVLRWGHRGPSTHVGGVLWSF